MYISQSKALLSPRMLSLRMCSVTPGVGETSLRWKHTETESEGFLVGVCPGSKGNPPRLHARDHDKDDHRKCQHNYCGNRNRVGEEIQFGDKEEKEEGFFLSEEEKNIAVITVIVVITVIAIIDVTPLETRIIICYKPCGPITRQKCRFLQYV